MKIWFINHYAVPPQYYPLARPSLFAKNLMKKGHDVTIIAASTAHNSDVNLITGDEKYARMTVDGIPYLLIKCSNYTGNGVGRIVNILQFAFKLEKYCDLLDKPDLIMATSFDPISCYKGIKYAKKHKIKAIAEIADLWPATLVAHGMVSDRNLIVKCLRVVEKRIYTMADSIVFTMEGAYEYIEEQQWTDKVPKEKVFYINNGIDLKKYDFEKEEYRFKDDDLEDPTTYKIVYTGSLRKANSQILFLLEAIKLMQGEDFKNYRFLIYGKGELEQVIRDTCNKYNLTNVVIKPYVEKKYIPYVLSKCDLNILNCQTSEVLKYGGSQNKMFDYLASGHPILSGEEPKYSVVAKEKCGIARVFYRPEELVEAIKMISQGNYSYDHIRSVAKKYDFEVLSNELSTIMEGIV